MFLPPCPSWATARERTLPQIGARDIAQRLIDDQALPSEAARPIE
ncbi:MAG: hypothetical protein ACRDQD_27340 [Nocardioidaceae bacterium]